jgi:hypothetical protein
VAVTHFTFDPQSSVRFNVIVATMATLTGDSDTVKSVHALYLMSRLPSMVL